MEQKLLERRRKAEDKFAELEQQKAQIHEEMIRLQGEYRVINELLENLPKGKIKKTDANTIDVEGEKK